MDEPETGPVDGEDVADPARPQAPNRPCRPADLLAQPGRANQAGAAAKDFRIAVEPRPHRLANDAAAAIATDEEPGADRIGLAVPRPDGCVDAAVALDIIDDFG